MRTRRLILDKFLDAHVIALWNETTLGDLRNPIGSAQPVRDKLGIDVVDEPAGILIVVASVEQKLFSRLLIN